MIHLEQRRLKNVPGSLYACGEGTGWDASWIIEDVTCPKCKESRRYRLIEDIKQMNVSRETPGVSDGLLEKKLREHRE